MKKNLQNKLIVLLLLLSQNAFFGQTIDLGTASNFVLFTTVGAVTNTGISHITGNVGSNSGAGTGFGNVNGVMHSSNGVTGQAAADLGIAYDQLDNAVPTFSVAPLLGNGQILPSGVYAIGAPTTLNLQLILNGQGNPNAVWIFQIDGAFASSANAEVVLLNGAQACNVFWKIEGLVSLASNTIMKGTIVANNAGINLNANVSLEGRALSTSGAIGVNGITAKTPIGCGSTVLNGPAAPALNETQCYVLFSSNGAVTNSGVTTATGDIGTNVGLTTGFNQLLVNGEVHNIPDTSTAAAAASLTGVYNYLNLLPHDIQLLYPAQFGNDLVLTPHTYLLNAATVFNGNLYLNAEGNADAVFVIKINGALSTSTYAKVFLMNGTQAKNVYWKINGAIQISDYSEIKGTLVVDGGVELNTGVILNGRVLVITGAMNTASISSHLPEACGLFSTSTFNTNQVVTVYPNPFESYINVVINNDNSLENAKITLYDISGRLIKTVSISDTITTFTVDNLTSGFYFYNIVSNDKVIQNGKLISK